MCGAIGESLLVDLLNEVGPCVADVGDVAVICSMVDEQADVVVSSLIGVVVVELRPN